MRIPRSAGSDEGGMGLTPLIDVVFLLLIFFIVATSFREPELALSLPAAGSAEPGEKRELLRVELTADGGLFVDGASASPEALAERLARDAARIEGLELRADSGVTHGRVVQVLDAARAHDVSEISIAVEPSADGNP